MLSTAQDSTAPRITVTQKPRFGIWSGYLLSTSFGRSSQGRPREKLLSGIPCLSCNHNLTLWKRKIVDYSTGYSGSTSPPGGEGRIVASVWYQTPTLTSPKAQCPCPDGSGLCEPFNIIALYYIIVE